MEKTLYKKSYQLNSLKLIKYQDLWGTKGIFSTIRMMGYKPKLILLKNHIKIMNLALKKMNIKFVVTEKLVLQLLNPAMYSIISQDSLIRIAINSKIISISLRPRLKPYKKFIGILHNYQRPIPELKNLYYRRIIKLLNSINSRKQEIILHNKGLLLEGSTTNIFCIRNKTIYIPLKNYYQGTTMNYLLKKTKRKVKKLNIAINTLHQYEEILLIGSGKGIVGLTSISQIDWKSQSNIVYKELLNLYKKL